MGFYFEPDENVRARLAQQRQAQIYRQQEVPPITVQRLMEYQTAYPTMDVRVLTPLARLGVPVTDPRIQKIMLLDTEKKKGRNAFDFVGDVIGDVTGGLGKVVAPVARGLDAALGGIDEYAAPAAKAGVRTAFVALESPLQEVQNFSRAALYSAVSGEGLGGIGPALDKAGSSSLREVLGGDLGLDDLGEGFLPGGKVEETVRRKAGQLELNINGVQLGGEGNQAITLGRVVASTVAEPGTAQYNILSGLTDATVAWFGDPTAIAGSVAKTQEVAGRLGRGARALADEKSLASAARAASIRPHIAPVRDDTVIGRMLERAGGLAGHRPSLATARVEEFLSKEARHSFEKMKDITDPLAIRRATGGKQPVWLDNAIAEATTGQEIDALYRSTLGTALDEFPEFSGGRIRRMNRQGVRMLNKMPAQYMDNNSLEDVFEQLERYMVNASTSPEVRDDVLRGVMAITGRVNAKDITEGAMKKIADDAAERLHLKRAERPRLTRRVGESDEEFATRQAENPGARRKVAETDEEFAARKVTAVAQAKKMKADRLTRIWGDTHELQRAYLADEIIANAKSNGYVIDDAFIKAQSPYLPLEYLNNGIPLPNVREFRRATSDLARLVDNPFFENTVGALDELTRKWKQLQLIRMAYSLRVLGEEQFRLSSSGLDSLTSGHPIRYVAALIGDGQGRIGKALGTGKIRQIDPVTGKPYFVGKEAQFTELLAGMNNKATDASGTFEVLDRYRRLVSQDERGFMPAWRQSLGQIHHDGVWQKVIEGRGDMDSVKQWFWSGPGQKLRREMVRAGRTELDVPAYADNYLDTLLKAAQERTGNDPILLDMLASGVTESGSRFGRLNEASGKWEYDEEFLAHLENVSPPSQVVGEALISGKQKAHWDRFMGFAFDHLMVKPTNYLHRNPVFRQLNYQRIEEMLPFADETIRARVLKNAAGPGGADKAQLKRLQAIPPNPNPTISNFDDFDMLAKKHALNGVKDLLYDLSEKSQFFDAMRIVMPFGEAWKEVFGRWARILAENPRVARRGQQIVTAARGAPLGPGGSGFFHKDDEGNEVFAYPGSRFLSKLSLGMPVDFGGPAAGFSMMTDVLPGTGPVVQISAAALLPDTPDFDRLNSLISPYGRTDYSQGFLESILPTYGRKVVQLLRKGDSPGYAKAVMGSGDYLLSTGRFNDIATNPETRQRWLAESKSMADKVSIFSAIASFGSPVSPSPQFLMHVPDEEGKDHLILQAEVAKDFRTTLDENEGDWDAALEEFIDRHGEQAFLSTTSSSFSVAGRLPLSPEAGKWEREHTGEVEKYRYTWGLFAPSGTDEFDFDAYKRQLERGDRKPLTAEQRIDLGQQRLGAHVYAKAKASIGDKPNKDQREWLAAKREEIRNRYLAYGRVIPGMPQRVETATVVEELRRSATDPKLMGSEGAKAARLYLAARDSAVAEARRLGSTAAEDGDALQIAAAADVRRWLAGIGRQLVAKYASFAEFYDAVFSYEVEDA